MTLGLVVGVFAGVGALARAGVTVAFDRWGRPVGTHVVNTTGSFLLGFLAGGAAHLGISADAAVVAGSGLAGGYTTTSTWAAELVALAAAGRRTAAVLTAAVSLGLGLGAAALGLLAGGA